MVLFKACGKCTTDHISPAGFWLQYRGHLDRISDNLLQGAVDDFSGEMGRTVNVFTEQRGCVADVARDYKKRNQFWVIFGDENYGEGSSREHAAMTPRYLGAKMVIVKSFARIHESNLKKQGVLPLTFVNSQDYNKVKSTDRVSFEGWSQLQPGSLHTLILSHEDGTKDEISVAHSLNPDQVLWIQAGSSLNALKSNSNKSL